MNGDFPLISVVVITYNSAKYVLETLESIKNQTYENLELIISDDCSKDDTAVICRGWLENNCNRFVRGKLVVSAVNKGIPANCNQGLETSTGEWVKFIAGDDLLLPDCISIFCEESKRIPDAHCLVSQMYVMKEGIIDRIYKPIPNLLPLDASKQLLNFIRYKSLSGPALFFKRNVLIAAGKFNEKYRGVEDYPLFIRFSTLGYLFAPVNRPTIIYRVHGKSVTNDINSVFLSSYRSHFQEVVQPIIKEEKIYSLLWHYWLYEKHTGSNGFFKNILSWVIRFTDFVYWEKKMLPLFKRTPHAQIEIEPIAPIPLNDFIHNYKLSS